MDRQTMMLELTGLSRVVSSDVRDLVYKRRAVTELVDSYQPVNPFLNALDDVEAQLMEAVQHSIYLHLSKEERQAFMDHWREMPPDLQLDFLDDYVREAVR